MQGTRATTLIRKTAFLLIAGAATFACGGDGIPSTGTAADTSALFTAAPTPINVVTTADASHAATQTIGQAGGSVVATGADGTKFTLDIPANALADPTLVTLTPLTSMTGLPLTNGMVAGVQMAPDGLVLEKDATLTIAPVRTVPVANQTFLSYLGTGNDLHLGIPASLDNSIQLLVQHFSGAALGDGISADRAAMLLRHAADYQARIEQEIAQYLTEMRQQAILGQEDGFRNLQALENAFESFHGHVVIPRVQAASASCANAVLALRTVLQEEQFRQRLGIASRPDLQSNMEIVLNAAAAKCAWVAGPTTVGQFTMAGTICNLGAPFTLTMTTPYGSLSQKFVPASRTAGSESYSGTLNGTSITGTGTYVVAGMEAVGAALNVTDQQCISGPGFGPVCGGGTFPIPLKRLDHGC